MFSEVDFFLQKSLTGTSDDDRVTHIVLQGFETNGIRVLRRLNSIEGYVQTYVLFLLGLFGRKIAISSAELENASASPEKKNKVNVTIQSFHL